MATKTIRRSISMTPEMHDLLAQIAARQGRDVNQNDLIREAIRHYLDAQADIIGSRRHFQKSLQARIDTLEHALTFQTTIIICLLAEILADDTAIDEAIIAARRDGPSLLARIAAVRDLKPDA
ncbi:MAG: ribbon-helix-helix protein, CopG family [Pleurocapsa minor GSE-CHR-MK-17-07R]|jgi:predicted HicB family RNase H-like nuclease|nr:ribbon-helix-helix protein, CopG family [Pleurocapsa minor GSE-CHR-MK 17-07R]